MIPAFAIAQLPRIVFGDGVRCQLPALIAEYGKSVLLVTGAASFCESLAWGELVEALGARKMVWHHVRVSGEPSPELADRLAQQFRGEGIEVVVGIGGGSVLDAAKAVAGLLDVPNSVMDYLEGVGPELPYQGPAVPFIAVPTTAGTGSEATKNAVLSKQGVDGFKKSFRHDSLIAKVALVDPELLATCPKSLIAADGMDAFTQLLESYVSLRANPFTDALALSGMRAARDSLLPWYREDGDAAAHRCGMAYASLLSGITLAQVGLGSVHGLAAPLGAFFPIPHGVVCGTLVAECSRVNIRCLRERGADSPALAKYAEVGRLLVEDQALGEAEAHAALLRTLADWTERLQLPRLAAYGMKHPDIARVVANSRGSSMKTNPVVLRDDEVAGILERRL